MPIIRTLKNNSVIQAMFFGGLTGLIGVGLFIFILQMPVDEKQEELLLTSQTEPLSEPEIVSQTYVALQHGVFSNFDSAAQFLASYPTLNKAAIFEVQNQFYVWSRMEREKVDGAVQTIPTGFYKKVTVTSSCPQTSELQLPMILNDEKWLTLQAVTEQEQTTVPEDWVEQISAIHKLTTEPGVIRLHAVMNYYERLDCLKMTF